MQNSFSSLLDPLAFFSVAFRVVASTFDIHLHDGMTFETLENLLFFILPPLRHLILQKIDKFSLKALIRVKIFYYACETIEFLLEKQPDIMSDEGDIARKTLVDSLLNPDAGHQGVQMPFELGNVDQPNYYSS